jgi:hypothetical protein
MALSLYKQSGRSQAMHIQLCIRLNYCKLVTTHFFNRGRRATKGADFHIGVIKRCLDLHIDWELAIAAMGIAIGISACVISVRATGAFRFRTGTPILVPDCFRQSAFFSFWYRTDLMLSIPTFLELKKVVRRLVAQSGCSVAQSSNSVNQRVLRGSAGCSVY